MKKPDPVEVFAKRLPISNGQLHLLCPAGIGDFAWIWSKWHAVAAERDCTFWFPQGEQKRAGALAQMYGARYGYMPGLNTRWVWEQEGEPKIPSSGAVLPLHPNRHLEAGYRIEEWYPGLPFKCPVPELNTALYKTEVGTTPYVVAFLCHEGYMEGNLLPGVWARVLQHIEQEIAPVVLVGADKDVPFIEKVCETFDPTLAPITNASLDQVLAAIQGSVGMIGVAGGLSIISTYLGIPTLHAYPRWLAQMPGSWEHEGARASWCFVDELPFNLEIVPMALARKT